MQILEREEGDRYEAYVVEDGILYSKVVYRDKYTGWPYDYKQKAHTEITRAVIKGKYNAPKSSS